MQVYKESHKKQKREKDKTKDDNFLAKKFQNRLEAVEYETSLKQAQGMTEEEEKEQQNMKQMFEKRAEKAKGADSKEEKVSKPKNFKPVRGTKATY